MKRRKRLLALALAGVLAGQMGVVAWGTGTPATTPTVEECKAKGYGSLQRVTAACTEQHTHWIDSRTVNGGGKGDDYYFVSTNDQINCDTEGKNNIVVDPSRFTTGTGFLLAGFRTGIDKIYVLGKSAASLTNLSSAVNPSSSSSYVVTIDEKTITITGSQISSGDVEGKVGSIFTGLTLTTSGDANPGKNESRTITAKPTGGVGNITYTWERYTGTTKDNFTYTGKEYSFTVSPDAAVGTVYTFKCTATDELGCTASAETTFTVTDCEKTVSLEDISGVPSSQAVYAPEKDADLDLICSITESQAGKCNVTHPAGTVHGHKVAWSVTPKDQGVAIVEADGKTQLKVTAKSLPDDDTTFTVTAKLDGKDEQYKTATFTAKKYVEPTCGVTPNPEITGEASINEDSGSTVRYTLNWRFDEAKCTISHAGPNHDYIVTDWNFKQGKPDYVTGIDSSNSTGEAILHIDPQKLPATPEKLILTATITNNPAARTGDATVEKEITFQNNARATCDATPKSITLTLNNGLTEAKWDVAKEGNLKIIPFVATPAWDDNSCQDSNHLPNNHEAPQWSIDNLPSWLTINPANGELTANKATIPNPENKVAVRVTLGTGANAKTDTKELIITRPPKCDKKIKEIKKVTGQPDISIEQGSIIKKEYYLVPDNLIYEGTTCECGDQEHNKGLHNEVLIWEVADFDNKSNVIDKDTAFKIDENGILTVRGDKLKVGTYHVDLRVSVKDSDVTLSPLCRVNIYCTTPDDDDDDSDHWESYEDKIEDAKRGSTVKMDLTGNGEVPFYVFESARGRDVTLQMKAGKNYTWTINGKAMKKWPAGQIYLPLEVETLKDKTLTRLCRDNDVRTFKLRHEGSFYGDMKLTVDVGVGNAKKTMYLYSYDEDKERLTYQSCALADNDGDVTFVMTRSLGAYAVTSKALYGEKPVSGGGGLVNGSGSGPTTVYPPVAPAVPSSSQSPSSSSSSSSSGSESSSQSEPALPPEPPASSQEPAAPADTDTKPKDSIPVLVPVLILAIAGVITATVLVVRSSRGRLDDFDD